MYPSDLSIPKESEKESIHDSEKGLLSNDLGSRRIMRQARQRGRRRRAGTMERPRRGFRDLDTGRRTRRWTTGRLAHGRHLDAVWWTAAGARVCVRAAWFS